MSEATPQIEAAPAGPGAEGKSCGVCQTPIAAGELVGTCPHCAALHHADCWTEIGGCSRYGCDLVRYLPKEQAAIPQAFWGQEKKACSSCGSSINVAALRCRHCGTVFEDSAPKNTTPAAPSSLMPVVILVGGILPVTAPLALVVGGLWAISRGKRIRLTGFQRMMMRVGLIASMVTTALLGLAFLMTAGR